jgi:GntR family transcriptional regulator, galactonate operon transcriptional repressor
VDRIVDPSLGSALLAEHASRRRSGARLGSAVVAKLVEDIVGGEYQPGATLPTEADLGTEFGVSRTVIRESVMLLQDKGLVRIIQGKGTLVLDPQAWNMIDDVVLSAVVRHDDTLGILEELIVVRAALEREMAAAAAVRATPAQLELVSEAFAAMRRSAADTDAFALADVRFHDTVMEISGNRLARAIVSSIHDKARATLRYRGATLAGMIAQTLDEHRAIVEAIGRRDGPAANQAMYDHITGAWARRRPAKD